MLHEATTTTSPGGAVLAPARASHAVLGGEAWIVPFEPGGPVWVTASAPRISMIDRRVRAEAR